jgi:iodothyronine deiodinase-like protein
VAFFVIYILEAHPIDAWQSETNVKEKIAMATAKNFEERCSVAENCLTKLSVHLPALIDDIHDSTEKDYTGWPDRLYVIDYDRRIAYKSRPGPFGFHPQEVALALKRLIPASSP